MAKLELEFVGYNDAINSLTINGKRVKLTKNKNNTRTCLVEAEHAEIVVYKTHNYFGKRWFWWNLFYYLISVFGLLDFNRNKRCLVVDFRFNLNLTKETKVVISIQNFENGGKFAEIECEEQVDIINNVQYFDVEGQKRHKKMKPAKIGIFLLFALVVTLLIILL